MHRDGTENMQKTGTEERPQSTYSREERERDLSLIVLYCTRTGEHPAPLIGRRLQGCVCAIGVLMHMTAKIG